MAVTVKNTETLELSVIAGDHETFSLTFTSGGSAYDLTNGKLWFTVKNHYTNDDDDAVLQKSVTSHDDAENGQTTLELTKDETVLFVPGNNYWYDFQFVDASGHPLTILRGQLKALFEVTKSG